MKLYQKLKELDLVEDRKDFNELVWMRSIKVNGVTVDNPSHEINENEENIQVGILKVE